MTVSASPNSSAGDGFEKPPSIPPKHKLRRNLFMLIFAGLSLYFVLPQFGAIEHALLVLRHLKLFFVGLSVGAQVLSYVASGYLLKTTVARQNGPVSVCDGVLITLGANSIGTLGGGVVGTAGMSFLWLRHRGVSVAAAGLGAWLPIFLNDLILAAVSLAGLAVLLCMNKFSSALAAALGLTIATLVGVASVLAWGFNHRARVMSLISRMVSWGGNLRRKQIDRAAIEKRGYQLLDNWDMFLRSGWRGPAAGAVLNTGFDMLTLASLFAAAGHRISPFVLLAGYGVPQLLGKLTVILGGVGVVEASMVGLYYSLHVPNAIAIVVVLAYRLFSFWLPTLLGIALVPYLNHKEGRQSQLAPVAAQL